MPRSRVFSFSNLQTAFGTTKHHDQAASTVTPTSPSQSGFGFGNGRKVGTETANSPSLGAGVDGPAFDHSPSPHTALQQQQRQRADSGASRPPSMSMLQTHAPGTMDVNGDTPPELAPIFSFLNSHSNKLYQEGYFLKLHDLDSRGRPSTERNWTECFAQLVGTVLSLWDAAALDAAGEEGEVLPTFINLSDASIKMIESLPMNSSAGGNLQNVLSISTAANNRYLLHFNSLNSLTQWTAGIRLAMYEHATLQEAYTGSLIAGKGKTLNNIKAVMERSRFKSEDWARVRFGAGTAWRRCWCVISPPDEKEFQKMQKAQKKKNPYEKTQVPKGDIKFYDTRKVTKKTRPIATISDAYAAYAIYPQSKPLIDQSTLVKVEGLITIHSSPETTTEGFLFVMPEAHPAVTGFEMMLRWLFPVWDTFTLYGRPNRLIADTLDSRGLMFAMPRDRRYGYLDILDVSGLIHTEGSQAWSERSWRAELKKLTSHRMNAGDQDGRQLLRGHSKSASRTSLPSMNSRNGSGGVRFNDAPGNQSQPVSRRGSPAPPHHDEGLAHMTPPRRAGTDPANGSNPSHRRSVSESMNYKRYQTETPSRLSVEASREDMQQGPPPPSHGVPTGNRQRPPPPLHLERINSERHEPPVESFEAMQMKASRNPVTPVAQPPEFMHNPSGRPVTRPYEAPELRRATSKIDAATLHQMQEASHGEDRGDRDPYHRPNGASNEVAINAERYAGMQADKSSLQDVVSHDKIRSPTPPHVTTPIMQQLGSPRSRGSPARKPLPQPPRGATPTRNASRDNILPSSSPLPHTGRAPSPPQSSASSVDEFVDAEFFDTDALDDILRNDRTSTMTSSVPDYALGAFADVRPSAQQSEKPRAGRLKIVGDPGITIEAEEEKRRSRSVGRLDAFFTEQDASKDGAIPQVDFGPTRAYKPTTRSSSRQALTPALYADGHSLTASPASGKRNSYFSARETPSPVPAKTPEDHSESQSQRRSMTWQPRAVSHGGDNATQSLSPEQWVQHRAALASQQPRGVRRSDADIQPQVHHRRRSSAGLMLSDSRQSSGDFVRSVSKTPPPLARTSSRNAAAHLVTASSVPVTRSSSALGAREQMQISRATGTPLVHVNQKDPRQQYGAEHGLYGDIRARESEKAATKKGFQSTGVQHVIAVKQQQDMNARMAAQFQMQQRNASQAAQAAQAAHAAHFQAQQQQQQQQQQQLYGRQQPQHLDPYRIQQQSQYQSPPNTGSDQGQQLYPRMPFQQSPYQQSRPTSYNAAHGAPTRPSPR